MKKLLAILLAVAMVLSLCACTANQGNETTGSTGEAEKSFTVTVVHADKSEKVFTYKTTEKLLGAYLEAEGLINSEGADDGMFHTVDGEKADWNENQSYWGFYIDGEYAMTGIYTTEIADGGVYKLEYTLG